MTICKYSNPCKCLKLCSLSKINTLQQPRKWDFDINGNPYYTDLADTHLNHKNHIICQHTRIFSQLAKIEPKESRLTVKKPYPTLK
jgi:hypothetical protein